MWTYSSSFAVQLRSLPYLLIDCTRKSVWSAPMAQRSLSFQVIRTARPFGVRSGALRMWEEALSSVLDRPVDDVLDHVGDGETSVEKPELLVLAYQPAPSSSIDSSSSSSSSSSRHVVSQAFPERLPVVIEVPLDEEGHPQQSASEFGRSLLDVFAGKSTWAMKRTLPRLTATVTPAQYAAPAQTATLLSGCFFHRMPHCSPLVASVSIGEHRNTPINADGLAVATPLGSTTFRNVVALPSIMDDVECIQVAAVRPSSLSFRPLIVPIQTQISIQFRSRNPHRTITAAFDDTKVNLHVSSVVHIQQSLFPYVYHAVSTTPV